MGLPGCPPVLVTRQRGPAVGGAKRSEGSGGRETGPTEIVGQGRAGPRLVLLRQAAVVPLPGAAAEPAGTRRQSVPVTSL